MFELDMHRLMVFYTVVNEGTLSKAGDRLYMSQPAISAHMKALEQQLGMPLFYRVGRRSVVNKAGDVLYKMTEKLFSVAEELKAEMENLKGVAGGRVSLGVSVGWQYYVPKALNQFRQKYPGVELLMEIANSDRIEKLVLDRTLDIGFVGRETSRPELSSEHLADDELVPICNIAHPFAFMTSIDIKQLSEEALIVRETDSATRRLTDDLLQAHNLTQNISMELGSYEAIKGAVMAGHGIGIVSRQALDAELQAGFLVVADIPQLRSYMGLHLIYHKQKKMTGTQLAFIEIVTSSRELALQELPV